MSKLVSTLVVAAAALAALNVQAASHAGGAPAMKASEPAKKASEPAKKEAAMKKEEKKAGDKK